MPLQVVDGVGWRSGAERPLFEALPCGPHVARALGTTAGTPHSPDQTPPMSDFETDVARLLTTRGRWSRSRRCSAGIVTRA